MSCHCSLQVDIKYVACKERAEREWARALNYFSLEVRLPPRAYAIRQLTSPDLRTHSTVTTTHHLIHAFQRYPPFRNFANNPPTITCSISRAGPFTSNHLPIQWHPLPLLRRRRAAISKMRNHAMPVRNGTATYPSACIHKAHLLAMRSPSPSPSHPVRRTTRDANTCANHLDF